MNPNYGRTALRDYISRLEPRIGTACGHVVIAHIESPLAPETSNHSLELACEQAGKDLLPWAKV